MYKCDNCEFECASKKLMAQHLYREERDLSEYEEKVKIRRKQKEDRDAYLLEKENGNTRNNSR